MRRTRALTFLIIALFAVVGWTRGADSAGQVTTPPPATTSGVTREVLAAVQPSNAPGEELLLTRVTFAPGGGLAPHVHPGTQLLVVESGTLRFVVVDGEAPVTRAGTGTPTAGSPTEVLSSGQETDLGPGDSWVEGEGVVHYAVNLGTEPVVLRATSLLAAGEPASQPVELAATPAA